MTTQNALALEIAALDQEIKKATETLAARKAELVAQVGDAGATIETALGTVTVTRQTEDRRTGMFQFALNTDGFLSLDERVQANLIKQGVVSKTEKVTKGQAPVVKVKAK